MAASFRGDDLSSLLEPAKEERRKFLEIPDASLQHSPFLEEQLSVLGKDLPAQEVLPEESGGNSQDSPQKPPAGPTNSSQAPRNDLTM